MPTNTWPVSTAKDGSQTLFEIKKWSGNAKEQVAIGKGKVDCKDFFEAGKEGGLKNFFLEMDVPVLKDSTAYLKKLSKEKLKASAED